MQILKAAGKVVLCLDVIYFFYRSKMICNPPSIIHGVQELDKTIMCVLKNRKLM